MFPQANVLMDENGLACITDFGLSRIAPSGGATNVITTGLVTSRQDGGTLRFQAPELLCPKEDNAKATKKSDIYAFAMTCIHVCLQFMSVTF